MNTNAFENESSKKRLEHLNNKRKEKLRFELIDEHGIKAIDAIESCINQTADPLFQKGSSYLEVYNKTSVQIPEKLNHQKAQRYQKPDLDAQNLLESRNGGGNFLQKSEREIVPSKRVQGTKNFMSEMNTIEQNASQNRRYEDYMNEGNKRAQQPQEEVNDTSSQGTSPGKRFLPVKPKQKIFDEWAAVVRHQDDVEKIHQTEEQRAFKDRQVKYRQQLDLQMAEVRNDKQKYYDRLQAQEYVRKVEKQLAQEEANKQEKKVHASKLMEESIAAKKSDVYQKRNRDQFEKKIFNEEIDKIQEEEKILKELDQEKKIHNQDRLKQSHAIQAQFKQNVKEREKQLDRSLAKIQQERSTIHEHGRQKYFDYLKNFQKLNSKKEELFKFFVQKDRDEESKRDEEAYLKAIVQKDQEETRKVDEQNYKRIQERMQTKQILKSQLREKEEIRNLMKNQERFYADYVKRSTEQHEQSERQRVEEAERKKRVYMENLKKQMDDQTQKKKYTGIMTEHERKINQKDIEAYENMDTVLHSKICGVRHPTESRQQDKYLNQMLKHPSQEKLESANPYSQSNNTELRMKRGDMYVSHNQLSYSPKQMGDARKLNERMEFRNNKYSPQKKSSPVMPSDRKEDIELALRNMNDPRVVQHRHNTYNRAYGYDYSRQSEDPVSKSFDFAPKEPTKSSLVAAAEQQMSQYGHVSAQGRQHLKPTMTAESPRKDAYPPNIRTGTNTQHHKRRQISTTQETVKDLMKYSNDYGLETHTQERQPNSRYLNKMNHLAHGGAEGTTEVHNVQKPEGQMGEENGIRRSGNVYSRRFQGENRSSMDAAGVIQLKSNPYDIITNDKRNSSMNKQTSSYGRQNLSFHHPPLAVASRYGNKPAIRQHNIIF